MWNVVARLLLPLTCTLAPQEPPQKPAQRWEQRLPSSYISVNYRSDAYERNDAETVKMRKAFGKKVVFCGTLGEGVIVTLFATPLGDVRPTARELAEKDGDRESTFDVGDVACREEAVDVEGIRSLSWYGVVVAGTFRVDVHVSTMEMEGVPVGVKFGRAEFEAFVKSLHFASTRRVGSDDYTDAIRDAMDRGLRAKEPLAAFDAMLKEKPGDPGVLFARAEVMLELERDEAVRLKLFREAVAAIDKTKDEAIIPLWVRIVALDGLTIRLQNSNLHKESIKVFERALALTPPEDPLATSLQYNFACSHARLGDPKQAVAALKRVLANDPSFKDSIAKDTDFDSLRKNAEFLALLK